MGGRAAAHTPTHIASPQTCRNRTRSAPTAACRRKRDPASAATPPTIPVCPTAVRAAVPEPFATSPPRQKDSESNPGRFRQRAVKSEWALTEISERKRNIVEARGAAVISKPYEAVPK